MIFTNFSRQFIFPLMIPPHHTHLATYVVGPLTKSILAGLGTKKYLLKNVESNIVMLMNNNCCDETSIALIILVSLCSEYKIWRIICFNLFVLFNKLVSKICVSIALELINMFVQCHIVKLSGSQIRSWVALSLLVGCSVVRPSGSVTSPLISTIWCFTPYKPYMMHVWWYLVVSGSCLMVSGGVWSMSGGVWS